MRVGRGPSKQTGAPWRIRTTDLLIRSQMLYPAELRARESGMVAKKLCLGKALQAFYDLRYFIPPSGGVAEWLMAPVLKTGISERVSGVRIPSPPPNFNIRKYREVLTPSNFKLI
jgi:hypothetical protein